MADPKTYTVPETQIELSRRQAQTLANFLTFEKRPPPIPEARWRVMQLGAVHLIGDGELGILADQLGFKVIDVLRAVDQSTKGGDAIETS